MPGREKELAAGFCLTEGYVKEARDILLIHHCGLGLPAPGEEEGEEGGLSRNRIELSVAPEAFRGHMMPPTPCALSDRGAEQPMCLL
jgi:formate dehydrogenase assembly factor FdhD